MKELKEDWQEIELDNIISSISETYKKDKKNAVLINTSDVLNGKVLNHCINTGDIKGQFKKSFKKNDILYSEIRPINRRFAFVDFDATNYIASTKLMVLRVDSQYDTKFIYNILKSNDILIKLQTIAELRSGTFPQITFNDLKKIKIKLPPLEEQKKIASIFSSLDDKIELNNRMNKILEETAQTIFKEWFINFNFPNEEGKPYKKSGGKMIESELGEIPEGWKVDSLSNIANFLNGLAMQKFRNKDNNFIYVLKIKELRQGFTDINSDKARIDIDKNYIVNNGDVIFSWSGTLMTDIWCGGIAGLNQHLFKVTSNKYEKWFYYFWIKKHLENFILIARDKTTTMGHIKREHLDKALVLIPNIKLLDKANNIFNPIIEQIINLRIENQKLAGIRDSILPKLMSGEIRIK